MEIQLQLIIILAFIGFCSAIQCYDCAYDSKYPSRGQKACDDQFDKSSNFSRSDCGGVCQKKITYPNDNDKDHYVLYRTCANNCEKSSHDKDEIHCCNGDLCNAASPAAVYSFIFTFFTGALAFLV